MKDALDDMLGQMGSVPLPDTLGRIDAAVLAGLAQRRAGRLQTRALALVALVALAAGGIGGWLPDHEDSLLAIAPPLDLAPSNLLAPGA